VSDQIDIMVQAEINRRRAGAEDAEREAIRAELERQVELAALDRKNREQLARATADGEQAMRLRSASRAPSGTPMAANGSAAPGEPQGGPGGASEAALAKLEKRRRYAREHARRKRAKQRQAEGRSSCVECGRGLRGPAAWRNSAPPNAGPSPTASAFENVSPRGRISARAGRAR
jgi:hypothetical protein